MDSNTLLSVTIIKYYGPKENVGWSPLYTASPFNLLTILTGRHGARTQLQKKNRVRALEQEEKKSVDRVHDATFSDV